MDSLAWVQGLSLPFWLHFQLCLNPSQRVKYALLWPFPHSFILPLYLPLTAQNLPFSQGQHKPFLLPNDPCQQTAFNS